MRLALILSSMKMVAINRKMLAINKYETLRKRKRYMKKDV